MPLTSCSSINTKANFSVHVIITCTTIIRQIEIKLVYISLGDTWRFPEIGGQSVGNIYILAQRTPYSVEA